MASFDGVFHMAAILSPLKFESDMFYGLNTNLIRTLNVLKVAAVNKAKKVVVASSAV